MNSLICLLAVFLVIIVHEIGHYLAGAAFGIPIRQMRIVLWTFPQHVAIKKGDAWISPLDYKNYVSRSREFLQSKFSAFMYVAGGFIAQTAVFLILFLYIGNSGFSNHLIKPITIAIVIQLFLYWSMDLSKTARTKSPSGDLTGLWKISKLATISLIGLIGLIHLIILFLILKTC
jgi:hypothetical protein